MVSSRPQAHRSSSSFGNGSSLLGAFGRRPRTANTSRDRGVEGVTDYAESSEDLTPRQSSRSRLHLGATSGLPRSSSSSQIHRLASSTTEGGTTTPGERTSRFAFPSSPSFLGDSRRPAVTLQGSNVSLTNSRPQTGGETSSIAMNRGENSSGNGSAIGRYLRRYSQGAGKNMAAANEAHAIAATASTLNNNSAHLANSGNSSNRNSNSNFSGYQSGSALSTSQTMPVLPLPNITGSPLHNHQELGNTEGAAASLAIMNGNNVGTPSDAAPVRSSVSETPAAAASTTGHRIRLVPHLEATRSLHFEPIERDLVEGAIAVKIGRFTDRGNPNAPTSGANGTDSTMAAATGGVGSSVTTGNGAIPTSSSSVGVPGARGGAIPSSAGGGGRVDSGRIAFKSKVVSRGHAEVWCEAGGKFFIRDTKSSSGTFLNHIRLSHPNIESKPFPLKDADVVQLGVDYQGGTEEIYRCVKMRVELNRGWQRGANQFNVNALRQLRALQGTPLPEPGAVASKTPSALPTNRQSMNVTDCCICLFSVTVCQALFIAPCSHVFHFKCIRPLIEQHHPGFSCPLCRTFADLDADVEEDEAWQQALLQEAQLGPNSTGIPDVSTPMVEETFMNLSPITPQIQASILQTSGENSTSSNSPCNPSSLRRNFLGSDIAEGNIAGDRRRPSASSASHRRVNDQPISLQRPDRAGSTTTTVPPSALTSSQAIVSSNTEREDEDDEEVMYEDPSSTLLVQDRRPSAPISIQAPPNSIRVGNGNGAPVDGFTTSPSFNDARTPQNEHFLSTLAGAPLPSRFSLRAMDPMGDSTLYPDNIIEGERRVSNATNNSSQMGTNDAYTTPAQGNTPSGGSSPLSATARSHHYNDDDDGNGDTNTSSSSAHNSKGKKPDNISANMQGAIDFLSGDGSVTSTRPPRRAREASLVGSIGSSDRGSSQNSRDAPTTASGKVSRFFKRTSSAVNN